MDDFNAKRGHEKSKPAVTSTDEYVTLWTILRILAQRKRVVIGTTLLAIFLAAVYVKVCPRQYRATSRVQVMLGRLPSFLSSSAYQQADPAELLETQIAVMRSAGLVEAAVESDSVLRKSLDLERALRSLSVTPQPPGMLVVAVEDADPSEAARLANAVVQSYIRYRRTAASITSDRLREQLQQEATRAAQALSRAALPEDVAPDVTAESGSASVPPVAPADTLDGDRHGRLRGARTPTTQAEVLGDRPDRLSPGTFTQRRSTEAASILPAERDELARTYFRCREQLLQLRLEDIRSQDSVRVIDVAGPPNSPCLPRSSAAFAIALVFGLWAGIGAALIQHHVDASIRDTGALKDLVPTAFVSYIPFMRSSGQRAQQSPPAWSDPIGRVLFLLTSASTDDPIRSVVVIGARGREGRSSVALHLAIASANAGKRTLLVDADMRAPSLHTSLETPCTPGFADVLSGSTPPLDAVREVGVENLRFLAVGAAPDPRALLNATVVADVLGELAASFEMVIVDSSPVLRGADALAVSRWARDALLVVESGVTTRSEMLETCELVGQAGGRIGGVVVNKSRSAP